MKKNLNKHAQHLANLILILVIIGYYFYARSTVLTEKNVNSNNIVLQSAIINTTNPDISVYENVDITTTQSENNFLIEGDFLSDGIVTDTEKESMEHNTKILQALVDDNEVRTIVLPSGTYYFTSGGMNSKKTENYVIKLNSNISIIGAGTDENDPDGSTILKPYAESGTIEYGLDMFYYNELKDSDWVNATYLENISFSKFIIDGESVRGNNYNTSGKGFMINLCKNCSWDNITVKNTDGTGFGMDNVINGKITNSTAINCGKNATTNSEGASGFGIGTGYSNEESMIIENCIAIGNTKYGFFFEHQGIFNSNYEATSSKGFIVKNSYASGNLYNFGGKRAYKISYIDCSSEIDNTTDDGTSINYTKLDIWIDDQSRNTSVTNFKTDNLFADVSTNAYYYDAIKWAYQSGITYGLSTQTFGVNFGATRAQTLSLLWRYAGRPGDAIDNSQVNPSNRSQTNINTGFQDVAGNAWYASAVKWGVDNQITNGTMTTNFSPDRSITRAEFLMMLWRYAGKPTVSGSNPFADVSTTSLYYDAINWAYQEGITQGTSTTKFSPSESCTREQVITLLYRYNNLKGVSN